MARSIYIFLGVCCLLIVTFAFGWTPLQERLRSDRIKQRKALGHDVSLQIDELYRQSDSAFEVGKNPLFVRCHYLGGRPYGYVEAALLACPDGPKLDYGNAVECASPFTDGGLPIIWRFSKRPEHGEQFTMRVTVDPRGTDEHHVDFVLPNQLKPYP